MSRLPEHPESFPVNALVPIKGTPLENNKPVEVEEVVRTIATARIVMPKSIVRIAAGRKLFSDAEQAMCFMAGANAIFSGYMLTTEGVGTDADAELFRKWGLEPMRPYENIDQNPELAYSQQIKSSPSPLLQQQSQSNA